MSDKKIKQLFLNQELQWLEFNRRVLHQAKDPKVPLLERVFFLSIFTSNLDEFVMKRVGGLKRQIDFGLTKLSHDGKLPQEQLAAIHKVMKEEQDEVANLYKKNIVPDLARHKILLKKWKDLSPEGKKEVGLFFKTNVFPVLTPLAVDPALHFPFISNLTLSLGVKLKDKSEDEPYFGRVKVPQVFPQWIEVKADSESLKGTVYVSLVQVIQNNMGDLFPGTEIIDVMPFRITRNADVERDSEETEDLLETIIEELKQRKFAEPVRLEHGKKSNPWMIKLIRDELELQDEDVYEVAGLLDYSSLKPISQLPFPHLKFKEHRPRVPALLSDQVSSIFDLIKKNDIFLHHPYDSFNASVERLLKTACDDSKVLAIKMTLYRTGDNSSIVKYLMRAAEQGKQVVCVVELKARFDEQRNIFWAQQMEKVGVHVIYGVLGLKTHCKTTLIIRQEGDKIKSYAHIGSGNYNSGTAKSYTDFGLLTSREEITNDLVHLFHYLTGRSEKRNFQHLLVAPMNMKDKFLELIEAESKFAQKKKPARIVAKFNALEDRDITQALYEASKAGVKIDLIVRGFCCLRPQVKGLSENIRVYSVVGRFLEHSRLCFFRSGEEYPIDGKLFIGSADWMYRNLHKRIEVFTPIYDRAVKRKCLKIIDIILEDRRTLWEMQEDGSYKLYDDGEKSSQDTLIDFE